MEKKKEMKTDGKYLEAIGRRKTASARVRLYPATKIDWTINERALTDYFPLKEFQRIAETPLKGAIAGGKFKISVKVGGGGYHAQAEAIRLGVARALLKGNPEERARLKKAGFLTRDAREVERKKFGLRKARRAPQWTKR